MKKTLGSSSDSVYISTQQTRNTLQFFSCVQSSEKISQLNIMICLIVEWQYINYLNMGVAPRSRLAFSQCFSIFKLWEPLLHACFTEGSPHPPISCLYQHIFDGFFLQEKTILMSQAAPASQSSCLSFNLKTFFLSKLTTN